MVASDEGEAARVKHFRPEQIRTLVQFVREQSPAPRVCIASTGRHALGLALAFGELPQAEVILLRPAAAAVSNATAGHGKDANLALALARYARRAA